MRKKAGFYRKFYTTVLFLHPCFCYGYASGKPGRAPRASGRVLRKTEGIGMDGTDCENGAALRGELSGILEKGRIKTVFQPIVSLRDGSVFGFESLSRGPAQSPLQNPDALFSVAQEYGMLWELELLCRSRALESVAAHGMKMQLFLNVNPHVIRDEKFRRGFTREYLQRYGIDPAGIFFEITEKGAVDDMFAFKETIGHYKNQGYKIVIDDAGAGYSGLNLITDIRPHYIKLDMNLIRGIDRDELKKALVRSMYDFSRISGILLVAEGIETAAELGTLVDIGVHYGQGFFLRRPQEEPAPPVPEALDAIRIQNARKNHVYFSSLSSVYIGNLCRENDTVPVSEKAERVYDLFLRKPTLTGVTVLQGNRAAGVITKTRIHFIMSGQYGFSLHAKLPVSHIMDPSPLTVDDKMPIDTVSLLAMSRPDEKLYDFIIVTKDTEYYGVVTIKNLLEKTMEIEVSNAKHQNPLSGLPGNLLIEHRLTGCLHSPAPFTVLYFDIDNFKAYNDVYGFENGDNVIRFLAELLCRALPPESFVGHVGGDDFVAVLPSYGYEEGCAAVTGQFDEQVKALYRKDDLRRGFILSKNRHGEEEQFPLMSLSVAGITNRGRDFRSTAELAEAAGKIKKRCKQQWHSCCIVD